MSEYHGDEHYIDGELKETEEDRKQEQADDWSYE